MEMETGHLILSRRNGESVMVDENIKIKVVGIKGNQVRLAFEAPKHVSIHREEIHDKILAERGN